MDPITTIGTVLDKDAALQRDCIHVAILPVTCGEEYLGAGREVKLAYGTTNVVIDAPHGKGIGIIDPFLRRAVRKGDRCWLFLRPGTVTGLRHDWICPEVDGVRPAASEAEAWLRRFADRWNMDYDEMVAAASAPSEADGDNYVVAEGVDLHSAAELGGDEALFWYHLAALTGHEYDRTHRERFGWSCSC